MGDPITPAADIFLLGITLYEMLTGTKPFKDSDKETVFQRIRETKYIPARKMNSTIPKKVDLIVKKCLERNPKNRYEDVKALIADIEECLGIQKSNHTADLILKYLDNEALISPSIAYSEIELDKSFFKRIKWALVLGFLCSLGIGFSAGYFAKIKHSAESNFYPTAKSILQKKGSTVKNR